MKVNVGSDNPVKVNAVKNAFGKYFKVKVNSFNVSSGVKEQPLSLNEIIKGAKNRAKKSFMQSGFDKTFGKSFCSYSVGIESGLIEFPSDSGFMECTVAVIFDGKNYFFGTSPLFEYPEKAVKLLLEGKDDVTTAFAKLFRKKNDLGRKKGAVGELTKGRINRTKFTELAVLMALMKIVGKEFY